MQQIKSYKITKSPNSIYKTLICKFLNKNNKVVYSISISTQNNQTKFIDLEYQLLELVIEFCETNNINL